MASSLSRATDSEIIEIARQTVTAATSSPLVYGSTAGALTAMTTAADVAETDVTNNFNKLAEGRASTTTKDASVDALRVMLGNFRDGMKLAGTPESKKVETSIPIGGQTVPSNATVPVGAVDTSQRLRHTISWHDAATPNNRRRPAGALGCGIYLKLDGDPPTDVTECVFVTVDSQTPYTREYPGADAGKMAHYLLRWHMRDGSLGPLSETISATITG